MAEAMIGKIDVGDEGGVAAQLAAAGLALIPRRRSHHG
jgi:hypothetical protein